VKRAFFIRIISVAVLLVVLTGIDVFAAPSGAGIAENNLFTVEVSPAEEREQILVAVHRLNGEQKSLYWSKKVPWKSSTVGGTLYLGKSISNDGHSVILHEEAFGDGWALIRKDAAPKHYDKWQIHNAAGTNVMDRGSIPTFTPSTGLLKFFLEEQQVYAVWFSIADKWIAIDLKSGELAAPAAELLPLLSAVMRTDFCEKKATPLSVAFAKVFRSCKLSYWRRERG
jgi:hypothetical protein